MQMATPTPGHLGTMTPEQLQAYRWEQEIDYRNRPLSDEELDTMLPTEGYKVISDKFCRFKCSHFLFRVVFISLLCMCLFICLFWMCGSAPQELLTVFLCKGSFRIY